jgi:prefoldin subunit 5
MKELNSKLEAFEKDLEKTVSTQNQLAIRAEQLRGAIFALKELKAEVDSKPEVLPKLESAI